MGSLQIEQKQFPALAGSDQLSLYEDWLSVQEGNFKKINPVRETIPRYIQTGRDLAWYVWNDRLYQAYFHAAAILVDSDLRDANVFETRIDLGNPYRDLRATTGFITFGPGHILSLLAEVAHIAAKAVWYQKWFVHCRFRPETFGGRIHNHLSNASSYPINEQVLNSSAVSTTFSNFRSYLLPQAFIEGSPMHSSYGAGHATIAGACTTLLKAFFNEDALIENPVQSSSDGLSLDAYNGTLTIGDELNKLAANISIGRNFAGIHYRSDYEESIKLGERVTIRFLQRTLRAQQETASFTLTRFNGKKISIT